MLRIGNGYYNPREIRRLGLNNRDNLVITYTNGEVEHTNEHYSEYRFSELIKEWEKSLVERI